MGVLLFRKAVVVWLEEEEESSQSRVLEKQHQGHAVFFSLPNSPLETDIQTGKGKSWLK